MTRRRSHLEMLMCALLVAVLAVQPAVGDGMRADKPVAAVATTQAKQASLLATAKATAQTERRVTFRAAQVSDPPPTTSADGDPATPPVTGDQDETEIVPGQNAEPEQGDTGATPATAQPAQTATPAADPAAALTGESAANSESVELSADARVGASPPDAHSGPGGSGPPLAVTPPRTTLRNVDTEESNAGAVTVPNTPPTLAPSAAGTATNPSSSSSPGATGPLAGPAQATSPALALPVPALEAALRTPGTDGFGRIRPGNAGDAGSGASSSAADRVPTLTGVADSGASDSSVGEVLVSWAKYALAVLALLVLVLGANSILAAARTRRLERQRERLMEDIGLLQAALLPEVPSRLGALLTTVAYRPADGPAAGGDFYDAFALPDGRVGLLLGDVSGHGRQALAKTTLVRFTVRAHLEAGLSPREALAISGRSLDGRLTDDFATVIAAIHDPAEGTLTYASAGHPPPVIVGPPSHRALTVSSAPPIGVGFPTGQRQTVLPMPEGSSVMIHSDGLLEARVDGVALGADRLADWLIELGPEATAKAVLDRVVATADRVPDDLAAVLVHAAPGATAPAARIEQLKLDVLDVDAPDLEGFLLAAGVAEVDRGVAGRRVSELLAKTSGVIVEVRTGEHPMVSIAPIGDDSGLPSRMSARTR